MWWNEAGERWAETSEGDALSGVQKRSRKSKYQAVRSMGHIRKH